MNLKDLCVGFLKQTVLASIVLLSVLLVVERLLPGFAAPFVDLPYLAVILSVLLVIFSTFPSRTTRVGRTMGYAALLMAMVVGGSFVWSRVNDLGTSGLVLMVCTAVLAGLTLVAFAVRSE